MEISDLVGLREPITEVVKAIRAATGIAYDPIRTRQKAKANKDARIIEAEGEAEALKIKTEAEIQSREQWSRAAKRLSMQEIRRQSNIEDIIDKHVDELPDELPNEEVEPDWLARFFQECKDTSDDKMQSLWARVLAGEFEKPGSFSMRTLQMMKNLSKREAEEIRQASSRVWEVERSDGKRQKFINIAVVDRWRLAKELEEKNAFYVEYSEESQMLQDCGFLHTEDFKFHFGGEGRLEPDLLDLSRSSARSMSFFGHRIIANPKQPGFVRTKGPNVTSEGVPRINKWTRDLEFDAWRLSREGEELMKIIEIKPDQEQFEEILATLKGHGFTFEHIDATGNEAQS